MQRLFFNASSWLPTRSQWLHSGASIQEEERKRILQYVFREDCISALIGRIMLRYVLCLSTNASWGTVSLTRTEKGKPVINKSKIPEGFLDVVSSCSFNISHNGRHIVAVSDMVMQLGVDVMKVTEKHGEVDEFFRLMAKNFTNNEWKTIKSQPNDKSRMTMFYRHWCLKESFVKAIGKGIGYSLQKLDFHVAFDSNLTVGEIHSGSTLYIGDILAKDWLFEETMVDEEHCVAVATASHRTQQKTIQDSLFKEIQFEIMERKFENISPEIDETFWNEFEKKKCKRMFY